LEDLYFCGLGKIQINITKLRIFVFKFESQKVKNKILMSLENYEKCSAILVWNLSSEDVSPHFPPQNSIGK